MAGHDLKAVLVGCGNMSKAWLNAATKMRGLAIVGMVDISIDAARRRAAEYQLPESVVFGSLAEALAATKPDMVFDVTIPAAHKSVTIEALQAGCHVLGEKPMAEKLEDAQQMVAAAKQAGKLYAVIQNRRYEPGIRRVRKTLDTGGIGSLAELHVDFYLGPHFGGFREEMAHPLLVDMAIHTLDAARFISQADPVTVYCHGFNPAHSWYKGKTSAVAIFEMSDGIVFTYRGSWCAQGLHTTWEGQWRIIGSKGSLTWDGAQGIAAQQVRHTPGQYFGDATNLDIPEVELEHTHHAGIIREFVDCVRTGKTPLTICEDNIKSLAMVLAAVKSAESGQREKVVW